MNTIAITGGTGFVGRHISRLLTDAGHSVLVFSRTPKAASGSVRYAAWNPDKEEMDTAPLRDVDAIIHLAGAGVAERRWTPAYKAEIVRSRVDATHFLHRQLAVHAPRCRHFIASSATGYYGPDRDGLTPYHEDAPPYTDFLAEVCRMWEEATFSARAQYDTVVALRTGIVLGQDGGAYPQLAGPMRFGIMPILGGTGRQVVSWIHIEDLAQMYIDAALGGSGNYQGVYNAVAPQPVTHLQLMRAIAKARGGLAIPAPVPRFVLNLIMGEASVEVLKSCTVSAGKMMAAGFQFAFPEIDTAVRDIAGSK